MLPELSIRQLLIASGIAAVLPALLLGVYALSDLVARDQRLQQSQLKETARSITTALDNEIDALTRKARLLAGTRQLLAQDRKATRELLADAAQATRHAFVLFDREGRVIVQTASAGERIKGQFVRPGGFIDVVANGRPTLGSVSGSGGERQFAILVPVVREGKVLDVLALLPKTEEYAEVLTGIPLPDGWVAAIDDPANVIVARSEKPGAFVGVRARLQTPGGGSGLRHFDDLEGRASLMAYSVSPISGFRAVTWAPESIFYAPSRALSNWAVALGGLTVILSLAAAFGTAELIGRPIRRLARTARDLEAGREVAYQATLMREANIAGGAMMVAAETIDNRETRLIAETEKTQFLLRELAHRMKNLLTVVSAIARQTARSTKEPGAFAGQLQGRLAGLSRSVDLLVRSEWAGVPLRDLAASQLEAFESGKRTAVSGPDVRLTSIATEYLGLALHELATNAIKHGALSVERGTVSLSWALSGDTFEMSWREAGGPAVRPPEHRGFGRTMIETAVPQALGGEATLSFAGSGIEWRLEAPADAVAAEWRRIAGGGVTCVQPAAARTGTRAPHIRPQAPKIGPG